jgi:polyhydroxyalkanoate synthesis regulator phasin
MLILKKNRLAALPARYSLAVILGMAGVAVVLGPRIAVGADPAASSEKFGNFDEAIADLRQEANQDRRQLVKANMLLTNSEGGIFWPLYDEYRADRNALNDKKVALVKDFLSKRDTMTQDQAEKLTKDAFDLQKDTVKLKEKYYDKMTKVLSNRTVARFFQIDQKLDAATDMVLAAKVPLIH